MFSRSIAAREIILEPVLDPEWERTAVLTDQYVDPPLGTVDVSGAAPGERHRSTGITTLDHRHFSVVRPRHISAFTLVPWP